MFVHNWPRRAEATIMVYTRGDLPGDSTGGEVAVYSCLVLCVCLADQQDAMQKKTFTKWVNSFLVKVTATYSLAHCMASLWQ